MVFVTARGDHALAAFEAGGVDHVLKPVDAGAPGADRRPRADAPGRARRRPPATCSALLTRLAGQVRKPAPLDAVHAGAGKETQWLPVEQVVYFEADSRYTRVVCDGPDGDADG